MTQNDQNGRPPKSGLTRFLQSPYPVFALPKKLEEGRRTLFSYFNGIEQHIERLFRREAKRSAKAMRAEKARERRAGDRKGQK